EAIGLEHGELFGGGDAVRLGLDVHVELPGGEGSRTGVMERCDDASPLVGIDVAARADVVVVRCRADDPDGSSRPGHSGPSSTPRSTDGALQRPLYRLALFCRARVRKVAAASPSVPIRDSPKEGVAIEHVFDYTG